MVAVVYGRVVYDPSNVTAYTLRTGFGDDPVAYIGAGLMDVLGCTICRTLAEARAYITKQQEAGVIDRYAQHLDRRA